MKSVIKETNPYDKKEPIKTVDRLFDITTSSDLVVDREHIIGYKPGKIGKNGIKKYKKISKFLSMPYELDRKINIYKIGNSTIKSEYLNEVLIDAKERGIIKKITGIDDFLDTCTLYAGKNMPVILVKSNHIYVIAPIICDQ